jgi:hypothetical protein
MIARATTAGQAGTPAQGTLVALVLCGCALVVFIAVRWGDDEHLEDESDRRWRR